MSADQGRSYQLAPYAWEYLKKITAYLVFFFSGAVVLYLYFPLNFGWGWGLPRLIEAMLLCGVYTVIGSGIGLFFLAILKFNEAMSLWNAARYGWLSPFLLAMAVMISSRIQSNGYGWSLEDSAQSLLSIGLPVSPGILVFFSARLMENRSPLSESSEKS